MKFKTKLTKLGRNPKKNKGFINPPIFKGSTIIFDDFKSYINDRDKIKDELESYFKHFVNEHHHANKEATHFLGIFSLLKQLGCEFFIINQAIKEHSESYYKNIYTKNYPPSLKAEKDLDSLSSPLNSILSRSHHVLIK